MTTAAGPSLERQGVRSMPSHSPHRKRVVIVGGGFAGLQATKALKGAPVEVVLLDRNNYHLFQPLLYQVASAALGPSEIASPLRAVLRRQRNVTVVLAEVTAIDLEAHELVAAGERVRYDWLVLAAGAVDNYFGHDDWAHTAPGLKSLQSAIAIRSRVLISFEAAEVEPDPEKRAALLTFVIVGAGPTGVEMAGAIKELAVDSIARDFRHVDTRQARVILVEAGSRLLPGMDQPCGERAKRDLEQMGVDVRLLTRAELMGRGRVRLNDEVIHARNIIWAAGVRGAPVVETLGVELVRGRRVAVRPDLSVPGHPEVFVVGDLAQVIRPDGREVPGVAPAAMQMGRYVGRLIAKECRSGEVGGGSARAQPFRFLDKGLLATIGRSRAVAQIRGWHFGGFAAWLLWSLVHITFLIAFRNRVMVLISWFYSYLFFRRGARLITTEHVSEAPHLGSHESNDGT